MLGTTKGSPAEMIYPKLGYVKVLYSLCFSFKFFRVGDNGILCFWVLSSGKFVRLMFWEIGEVPKNGISPVDGSLLDEVLFYKDLR